MGTRDTKQAIIKAALQLFNECGTRAVSTNHIARRMNVSPGLIYYHFRNKEQIIREIYREIVYFFNAARKIPRDRKISLADLRRLSSDVFHYMWEYRFFLREAVPLMQKDPQLKKRLSDVRRRRLVQIRYFLQGLINSGVMREPEDPETLSELSTIMWLITNSWPTHLLVDEEQLSPRDVQKGVDLMIRVIRPYLTAQAVAELDATYERGDPERMVS